MEAVWRIEAPRLIAGLARIVRDVGIAEELTQDALVTALEQWPEAGIPRNPGAWLMMAARNRAIDHVRRRERGEQYLAGLERSEQAREREMPDSEAIASGAADDDDLLRLLFTACHPELPAESRVALTLRVVGGLTTGEIARAFLVQEATIAQRIVRAKRILAEERIPYEVPQGAERMERLGSVLAVIYLIFNEGYAASTGDDWMRPALCEEAMRLARILAGLMPRESEVHGLLALLELQASRLRARTDAAGEPVLLLDQNRARWDWMLIGHGLAALERGERIAETRGPYLLQAAIAACHAHARTADATDWSRIAKLYAELEQRQPSPVVTLARAVALGMAEGPAAGLALADGLREDPALQGYHRLPAVRADLLEKLGRLSEAATEYLCAADLAGNESERKMLRARARACRATE